MGEDCMIVPALVLLKVAVLVTSSFLSEDLLVPALELVEAAEHTKKRTTK